MPRLAGVESIPNSFTPGTVISSSQVNANFADVASEITNSLARDGSSSMTGPLPLGANYVQASGMSAPGAPTAGAGRNYWKTVGGIALPFAKLSTGAEYCMLPFTITPQSYGATGDGTTDDTAALAAALTGATGKTLWIPDGTYCIASALTIPAGTDVIMSRNAVLKATAAMTAMLQTNETEEHSNSFIEGGFFNCNGLATSAIWMKWFNHYSVQNVDIQDHAGPNGAIRLGRAAGPSSAAAFMRDIRVNRLNGAAPVNSKGIEFEHAGDCHLSDMEIIGQKYGVYGAYDDSKLTRVHCWAFGPTHGSMLAGFYCLGGDAVHVQCQVDGPVAGNCYYANGARIVYIGCGTNNPALADGGTDQTAACVFVETGASAVIGFCTFKGAADARWSVDITGNAGADIRAFNNHSVNTTTVYGDSKPAVIASGSLSGSTITITNIPAGYSALQLQISGASCDTATKHLQIQVSTDNGATWDTTASNYVGFMVAAGVVSDITEATFIQAANVAAGNAHTVGLVLKGYADNGHMTAIGRISNGTTNYSVQCTNCKTAPINAIRFFWSGGGNFDAGTYALEGIH